MDYVLNLEDDVRFWVEIKESEVEMCFLIQGDEFDLHPRACHNLYKLSSRITETLEKIKADVPASFKANLIDNTFLPPYRFLLHFDTC